MKPLSPKAFYVNGDMVPNSANDHKVTQACRSMNIVALGIQ